MNQAQKDAINIQIGYYEHELHLATISRDRKSEWNSAPFPHLDNYIAHCEKKLEELKEGIS